MGRAWLSLIKAVVPNVQDELMRTFIAILFISLLSACSSHPEQAQKRVFDFYSYYLNVYANSTGKIKPDPEKMKDYVAQETLNQLSVISYIYEQEIVGSDYYTYAQDNAADWIPRLRVGDAKDYFGGKYVNVWLGCENNKNYQIGVYLIKEDGRWKIYRVKDITDNYEQYIFDTHAIEKAKQHAATIN